MLLLIGCCPALAVRFPDAVEKKIVLVGRESASVAELFGFGEANPLLLLFSAAYQGDG